ncbi:MAG: ABC transporter ATP-binding protein [Bacteroidetes bacterium]|nr:ABC transporter ATP-binding protein [Bacteroidota bacterium]MBP8917471.1 ABC transporter ATP-binding protein [Chitinophagales bacterium]
MQHLKSLNFYFLKYKWLFLTGTLFVALSNVFQVFAPHYIGDMIDLVEKNMDVLKNGTGIPSTVLNTLLLFAGLFVGFTLLRGICMFFMRQTIIIMSRHIEFDQKNALFAKYETLTPAFFKRNNTGDLMSRVAEDVGRVRQYVGPAVMYFINLVFNSVLAIWMMVHISPSLALYVLIPLPILSVSIYFVNSIINKKSELIQAQLSNLTSIAQESFSGIRVIQAYAQEEKEGIYFEENCEKYKNLSLSLSRVDALFQPLMVFLIGMSVLITIFAGGMQVMNDKISPGDLAEFLFYINMLTWPVTSLGWVVSIVQRAAASQKRINEFLLIEPDIVSANKLKRNIKGKIRFEDVTFTYPDTGVTALKNISFTIEPGEKVAIVGRTGAGKSTIGELLFRLYDPDSGNIYIDDIPIKEYNLEDLRKGMSVVPQDVFLFSDTIKNNISFSNRKATEEEVKRYAAFASIKDEIELFKDGFNTMVGERGVTLSGGQKQRVSIARAFLKNAPVILMDDSLSAVDSNTEKTILGNMRTYLEEKTAIIITHRIFSLLEFDQILVLDKQTISERGTHESLLERKGIYYGIYESQRREENNL